MHARKKKLYDLAMKDAVTFLNSKRSFVNKPYAKNGTVLREHSRVERYGCNEAIVLYEYEVAGRTAMRCLLQDGRNKGKIVSV